MRSLLMIDSVNDGNSKGNKKQRKEKVLVEDRCFILQVACLPFDRVRNVACRVRDF